MHASADDLARTSQRHHRIPSVLFRSRYRHSTCCFLSRRSYIPACDERSVRRYDIGKIDILITGLPFRIGHCRRYFAWLCGSSRNFYRCIFLIFLYDGKVFLFHILRLCRPFQLRRLHRFFGFQSSRRDSRAAFAMLSDHRKHCACINIIAFCHKYSQHFTGRKAFDRQHSLICLSLHEHVSALYSIADLNIYTGYSGSIGRLTGAWHLNFLTQINHTSQKPLFKA